ncbi:MAG: glutathione S-transferase N-terminal domain-containing protein [Alphaproteobacteria bacterium]
MKLYYSTTSPFVRKVSVFAIEAGLAARLERIPTNPWVADKALLADNPLSKVPTLVTDDGLVLYDSRVICEYLDSLHPPPHLFPEPGPARWSTLRLQALGDGIMDAAVLRFLERKRPPEQRSPDWDLSQELAVSRALDWLETQVANWSPNITIGKITVACALGYLDFRFGDEPWRDEHPALASWFSGFAARASMQQTLPQG